MWQAYETPGTVDETLATLARYDGRARIIAGGTDLIVELQEGKRQVECLVDVTRIPGLGRIEEVDGWIEIGANVTFRQIKESALLEEKARVLAEAAATVGALQIQTAATLAGNLVSALPAADGSVALLGLDAEALIAHPGGRQWRPVCEMCLGPGQSVVDPSREMIVAIRFRALGARQGSAWERIGRRRALVLPILNCGVSVALQEQNEQIEWARISLGPVGPVPCRAPQTERFLGGKPATSETFAQAGEMATRESNPRSSLLRASREYRIEVLKVVVRQGLARATEQARTHIA